MLEEVGIQIFVRKRQVRLNIIRELNNLKVNALFSEFGLDHFQNISVRNRRAPIFKVSAAFAVPKSRERR